MAKNIFTNRKLHHVSLAIARAFSAAYGTGDTRTASELLLVYRDFRRRVGKTKNGKRYGAKSAYLACKTERIPLL